MSSALARWWTRPGRTPRWLRGGVACVLATAGAFGIVAPGAVDASAPGPLTALGGPPSTSPNAPRKSSEPPGGESLVTRFPDSAALRAEGRTLYENGCSSCHGALLQGIRNNGPSLRSVGPGPVNFYVSTGRMPLQNPRDEPERAHPAYAPRQVDALAAFIAHTGGGPAAPAADPTAGNLSTGMQQFTLHCAGCHQIVARGGMVVGAYTPSLQQATPLQIAEAVRMGPYLMPHFDAGQIDQHQLDSLTRYIVQTRNPNDAGGWGIGNIGPIPEGMAAWFIAIVAMLIVARLVGERTGRPAG